MRQKIGSYATKRIKYSNVYTDITLTILDIERVSSKYGVYEKFLLKLENGKNSERFEYSDSIEAYNKKRNIKLDDVLYCLLSDYRIVEDATYSDVEDYLMQEFGYSDYKEITRISKALRENFNKLNNLFTKTVIKALVNEYENY